MNWDFDYPRYRSVGERRARSAKKLKALRKKGQRLDPILIEGRTITKTFWGKAWCRNLEAYSDYQNRLPRGRSYVRHGAVLHLAVHAGRIEALVDGSSTYTVDLKIKPLPKKRWHAIQTATAGEIDSLVELLEGRLSKAVMERVTDADEGLFPAPKEITLSCTCPDWADMCKHVAAVLYGVGARLDESPDLLFTLRGVDATELIEEALEQSLTKPSSPSAHLLDPAELAGIFGTGIDFTPAPLAPKKKSSRRKRSAKTKSTQEPSVPSNARATRLLALIAKHPGERTPSLATRLGVSISTTRNTLAQLRRTGAIHFEGAPRTGGYFTT